MLEESCLTSERRECAKESHPTQGNLGSSRPICTGCEDRKSDLRGRPVRQVFQNIQKCLEAAGATFDHVVKVNVYSTNLDAHMESISKVRKEYFPKEPVASTTVQVQRLVHPDWLVEIEAIAVLD